VIPLIWGGIAFLAILSTVAVCATYGDSIQNSHAYKIAMVWSNRFMHGVLIALCACLALFVPSQIVARVAISSCGIFNRVMDSPFNPGFSTAIEYRVRGRLGCPVPGQ
jgi:hypothetical protein